MTLANLDRMIFLGITATQWLWMLGLLLGAVLVSQVVLIFLQRLRRSIPMLAKDTRAYGGVARGVLLLIAATVWFTVVPSLGLHAVPERNVLLVVHGVAILGGVLLVYSLWDALVDAIAERSAINGKAEKLLVPVTRKLVRALILVVGLLIALGTFGVNVTGLIAGLGIGGLVVALAAKDSVENVFGSLTILFDMPFALGDWVKIGTVEGVVEEINLRSTRIRTFEDSVITLPNSNLIKASVENFGARRFRRQKFVVRFNYVSMPENVERFTASLKTFLDTQPMVTKERTHVRLNELTEANLGVLVVFFIETDTYEEELRVREEIMQKILVLAHELELTFAAAPLPPPPGAPVPVVHAPAPPPSAHPITPSMPPPPQG